MKTSTLPLLFLVLFSSVFLESIQAQCIPTRFSVNQAPTVTGTPGATGAKYKRTNILPGVDMEMEILSLNNGATLAQEDDLGTATGVYLDAWQPNINPGTGTGDLGITWFIRFFVNGTTTPYRFNCLSVLAVDVDGVATMREYVEAVNPYSYTGLGTGTYLTYSATGNTLRTQATTTATIASIDSTAKQAMVQYQFINTTGFQYTTGITRTSGTTTRQFSLFFNTPTNFSPQFTRYFSTDNDAVSGLNSINDLDDDNDGIPDINEYPVTYANPFGDADADGLPNYMDATPGTGVPAFLDTNSDGINDNYDADRDGLINSLDLDSDNDGMTDLAEAGGVDTNGDGRVDVFADADADGLATQYDSNNGGINIANLDTDGDGIPNFLDLDSDNDGIADVVEMGGVDANGDGRLDNFLDADTDGLDDTIDSDVGNDGVIENSARALLLTGTDTDADGRPNSYPQSIANTDGRGLPNAYDLDSDDDGISDLIEAGGVDTDNNGRVDGIFADIDGDGFIDSRDGDVGNDGVAENTTNVLIITGADADDNGRPETYPRANADGAGLPNPYDLDSDNDGIPDLIETGGIDSNGDGRIDDLTDTNNNGWLNAYDPATGGINIRTLDANGAGAGGGVFDFDGDGLANYLDLDSDGDGIPDIIEQGGVDSNNDGKVDATADVDNDGFVDTLDPVNNRTETAIAGAAPLITAATIGANNLPTIYSAGDDADRAGLINMLDLDADGDGILDVREAGLTDATNDGIADGTLGADGWSDTVDALASLNLPNTDARGNANYLDIDADDDGLPDNIETQSTASYQLPTGTDTDADGIDDAYDNNDAAFAGIANNGLTPYNHDGTDNPDYTDNDSDNDGVNDLKEGSGVFSATLTNTADADGDGLLDQFDTFNLNSLTTALHNNVTLAGMGNGGASAGPSPAGSNLIAKQSNGAAPNRDWRNSAFVLPLHLISFAVAKNGDLAQMTWVSENEERFKGYEVERSTDGISYTKMATLAGKGNGRNEYHYNDDVQALTVTKVFYRLRMVDLDGKYTYSSVAILQKEAIITTNWQVTPNPSKGKVTLHVRSTKATMATVTLFSNTGHSLFTEKLAIANGANSIALKQMGSLPNGVYIVNLNIDGVISTERIIIQR
jgi:hypothetical protein